MTFWNSTLRLRHKAHRCDTCRQIVARGEMSWDEVGIGDGDFSAYKQCRACNDIVRYFYWNGTFDYGEGFMLDELADYVREEGLLWPPVWNWTEDFGKERQLMVKALPYQAIFNAIADAVQITAGNAISVSVSRFKDSLCIALADPERRT